MEQDVTNFVEEREPEYIITLLFVSHLDTGGSCYPPYAAIHGGVLYVMDKDQLYSDFPAYLHKTVREVVRLLFDQVFHLRDGLFQSGIVVGVFNRLFARQDFSLS